MRKDGGRRGDEEQAVRREGGRERETGGGVCFCRQQNCGTAGTIERQHLRIRGVRWTALCPGRRDPLEVDLVLHSELVWFLVFLNDPSGIF